MTVSVCIKITAIMTSERKFAANYGPETAAGSQVACKLNALSVVNCCKLPRGILHKLGNVLNVYVSLITELQCITSDRYAKDFGQHLRIKRLERGVQSAQWSSLPSAGPEFDHWHWHIRWFVIIVLDLLVILWYFSFQNVTTVLNAFLFVNRRDHVQVVMTCISVVVK